MERGTSTNTVTGGGREILDRLGAGYKKIVVNKLDVNKQT